MKTLKDVKVGGTTVVVKVHGDGPVRRRIMDMGITKGVDHAEGVGVGCVGGGADRFEGWLGADNLGAVFALLKKIRIPDYHIIGGDPVVYGFNSC